MRKREPRTSFAALGERDELELTGLDEGKLREHTQGITDAPSQLHMGAVTRCEAYRQHECEHWSREELPHPKETWYNWSE